MACYARQASRPGPARPAESSAPGLVQADTFGTIECDDTDDYNSLVNDDPVYGERMRRHARNWFAWDTPAEYPWRQ